MSHGRARYRSAADLVVGTSASGSGESRAVKTLSRTPDAKPQRICERAADIGFRRSMPSVRQSKLYSLEDKERNWLTFRDLLSLLVASPQPLSGMPRKTTLFLAIKNGSIKGRLRAIWERSGTARWKKADAVFREWNLLWRAGRRPYNKRLERAASSRSARQGHCFSMPAWNGCWACIACPIENTLVANYLDHGKEA
jgi:hypothetical protein